MFLPRRQYRRLLLPPGWVALGFLLLLGCLALLSHERQMRLPNVMQLTMPILRVDSTNMHLVLPNIYRSLASLDTIRPWHDADFAGDNLSDFINAVIVENAIKIINADTSHGGGVRIRFHQQATYGNLVAVLDIMNRLDQKKYWLDIHHKPTTLYATTDKRLPAKMSRQSDWLCGTRYYKYPTPTEELTYKQILESLWQQDWRPTMLLFAVISGLSIYRLGRLRRTAC